MTDAKFELWMGHYQGDEDKLVVVLCREGVAGLLSVTDEMIGPLVNGDAEDQQMAALAMSMTFEYAHEQSAGHMSSIEWGDILDRQLVAEWSVPEAQLTALNEEFYNEHPHKRPNRTLH